MEVEDALSAKFRTLIERLMVTTTAEIVKIFSKVLLETRVEISRSWKEIDLLKQHLEESERQKKEAILRAQRRDFKREDDEVEVSSVNSQADAQTSNRAGAAGPERTAVNVSAQKRDVSVINSKACGPEKAQSSKPEKTKGTKSQNTKCTQVLAKPKTISPAKVKGHKASSSQTTSQPTTKIIPNGPSTSEDMSTSPEEKVKRRKVVVTPKHTNNASVSRALRDRQQLSMQRHCLCCSSDECDLQTSPSRAQHQVPSVYICRKCEKKFKTDLLFKSHICSMPQNCDRCGQVFTTLQGMSAHSQEVTPQFTCGQCEQTFATQCAWTVHKRAHTNLVVPKEMKAKRFEVRLERISVSQLEAALSPNSGPLQNISSKQNLLSEPQNKASADINVESACKRSEESATENISETNKTPDSPQGVEESLDSRAMSDSSVGQSSVRKVYAVMSSTSGQIQISEDADGPESTTVNETEKGSDEGKLPSGSNGSGLSTPKKRKMTECTHDAYNGVFPVENILRWRNNKGRNEVRVKWMPCTLCGAKFQNTWEPAESFPGYLDDKNEELKKS